MKRQWEVTLYNQHVGTTITAIGPSRPKAFRAALAKAGEPWLRAGGDKLTTLRTLFAEAMPRHRTTARVAYTHPNGAGIAWRVV